jgi:hypothetical protein
MVSTPGDLHLVEYKVERSVQLTFAVSPDVVQKFLLASWQAASMPPGPSEGAKFKVVFRKSIVT